MYRRRAHAEQDLALGRVRGAVGEWPVEGRAARSRRRRRRRRRRRPMPATLEEGEDMQAGGGLLPQTALHYDARLLRVGVGGGVGGGGGS